MIEVPRIDGGWPWPLLGARRGTGAIGRLVDINNIVSSYGATFSHGWQLNETSGNAADIAPTGALALTPTNTPTQGVSTGLPGSDKGVQFATGSTQHMVAPANGDLDVTTGSLIMYGKSRLTALPAGTHALCGKGTGGVFYLLRADTSGNVLFTAFDGTNGPGVTATANHVATTYFDWLAVIDRTSGTKLLSLNTSVADGGTTSATTLGTLTSAAKFALGNVPTVGIVSAPCIHAFVAWGTVCGTLVANRVEALTKLRKAIWS